VAEAINGYTQARIAGLCAGGTFPRFWAAAALDVKPEDVRYDFAGLNHMNFAYNLTHKGRALTGAEFAKVAEKAGDAALITKLGALPSPYLGYYFTRGNRVSDMLAAAQTRGEAVLELEGELYREFADPGNHAKPEALKKRGGGGYSEVATAVMDAIYNDRDTWAVVNVPNRGVFPFLPDTAVIETPCLVNARGITPIVQGPAPKAVWGLIAAVKNYETLTVEAAMTGDRDTALLALMAHPLVGDYDLACPLLDKLLEASREYLPNFF